MHRLLCWSQSPQGVARGASGNHPTVAARPTCSVSSSFSRNTTTGSNSPKARDSSPSHSRSSLVAVADTGSGTSLIVSDARYFQDGTYAPPGTVQADWIAVGSIANVVQIASISGDIITLANSITRNDNDPVWLYKKSDGVQVLYGSAPDAGAYEHGQAQAPSAPMNLRIIP